MNPSEDTPPDADAGFIDACRRLGGFDPRWDAEWFDGALTALATATRPPPLDEVLAVLVGDGFERCFADPDDASAARAALQRRRDAVGAALDPRALYDDPDRLHLVPLILEAGPAGDDASPSPAGAYWARGFYDAMQAFPACWPAEVSAADGTALERHMLAVAALTQPDSGGARERDRLIDAACFAAQDLRLLWLEQAVQTPPLQAAPKVGRNDPCPCGSGRKYKKCHGA